ncbi:MAG TPA: hypothetical protein VG453_08490 [Nitrospira sp.]|nr:hypothetical protein [Nitrospira sp.]
MKSYAFTSTGSAALIQLVAMTLIVVLSTSFTMPLAWSQEPVPAASSEGTEGGSASSAGMGAAAGLSTLLYLPLKAAFAIGGGVVGGLAYAFSGGNENAAKSIWTTSMYGTYIITPDHLRGDRPIRFLGVAEPDSSATAIAPLEPAPMEPVR